MTRTAYDTVAESYADLVRDELDGRHLEHGLLATFADRVSTGGVLEVGCGTGRIADQLHRLGLDVAGIDLSPNMIEVAQREHPHLRFGVGSMEALDAGDSSLAGIVAWYSIIHTPPHQLSTIFAELHRVLVPEGLLLLAFQAGNERVRLEQAYGHSVSYDAYRLDPDAVAGMLVEANFEVDVRVHRAPMGYESTSQAFLLARKRTS
ncbi:SAM-dependent methyltransferase [Rhodococcus sp. 05-2256-B2]|uniref:class I SAM-dependent DNA methyltransferase n=1 Tax=Nocardiaceae TaxID=85025 RepID=UPI000B9A64B2|nr:MULTISPECIES: class I SAM-dependent methyltransferase [Rhodococcus]MBX5333757.1 methyltransferase domain-containing protein [Rhodococcus fascians]MBY4060205.1 methyltransferase domain-containing protein [Rhodococcus fascians]MBY4068779.1 methyltransferase domain-containing protein [Rhodococcus fascians]MDJ0411049.1 methyltransferase domain-containing protein [Rhodococcus fascians]OZD84561.1 SAM-dependent methyltransferase [Rhodococcus sp. 05-2256-B4]